MWVEARGAIEIALPARQSIGVNGPNSSQNSHHNSSQNQNNNVNSSQNNGVKSSQNIESKEHAEAIHVTEEMEVDDGEEIKEVREKVKEVRTGVVSTEEEEDLFGRDDDDDDDALLRINVMEDSEEKMEEVEAEEEVEVEVEVEGGVKGGTEAEVEDRMIVVDDIKQTVSDEIVKDSDSQELIPHHTKLSDIPHTKQSDSTDSTALTSSKRHDVDDENKSKRTGIFEEPVVQTPVQISSEIVSSEISDKKMVEKSDKIDEKGDRSEVKIEVKDMDTMIVDKVVDKEDKEGIDSKVNTKVDGKVISSNQIDTTATIATTVATNIMTSTALPSVPLIIVPAPVPVPTGPPDMPVPSLMLLQSRRADLYFKSSAYLEGVCGVSGGSKKGCEDLPTVLCDGKLLWILCILRDPLVQGLLLKFLSSRLNEMLKPKAVVSILPRGGVQTGLLGPLLDRKIFLPNEDPICKFAIQLCQLSLSNEYELEAIDQSLLRAEIPMIMFDVLCSTSDIKMTDTNTSQSQNTEAIETIDDTQTLECFFSKSLEYKQPHDIAKHAVEISEKCKTADSETSGTVSSQRLNLFEIIAKQLLELNSTTVK